MLVELRPQRMSGEESDLVGCSPRASRRRTRSPGGEPAELSGDELLAAWRGALGGVGPASMCSAAS
jgi:hypothetical protein